MKVNFLNEGRSILVDLGVVPGGESVEWCGGYSDVGLEVLIPLRLCPRVRWVGSGRGPCRPWVIGSWGWSWCVVVLTHGGCERRMFEGFLSEGSKYGGDDPPNGRAVGVRAVVSLRAAVWSEPALPYP